MATVSVVTLAALTAYIVAGLLALAHVPDAGGSGRRLVQLALWPAAVVRTAASPARRHAGHAPAPAAVAAAPAAAPAVPVVPAAPVGAAAPAMPVAPATAAPTPPVPDAVAEPAPRDARGEWERFVLRLTELSD